MNQSKAFLISFVFAALAMALVFFYIQEEKTKIRSEYGNSVVVVVANSSINEMEEIQRGQLRLAEIPANMAQPSSQSDPLVFEGMVALAPIREGEQVLLTKVAPKGQETGISTQVAVHHRAISVQVDAVNSVNRLIQPGDRIDIVSMITYPTEEGAQQEVKTVLQNVHVLAVGKQIQNNLPAAYERDPVTGEKFLRSLRGQSDFQTITIEVTPLDAQRIVWVQQQGSFSITLRNPIDRQVSSIPSTTVDEILGANSKKALASRPPQARGQRGPP